MNKIQLLGLALMLASIFGLVAGSVARETGGNLIAAFVPFVIGAILMIVMRDD